MKKQSKEESTLLTRSSIGEADRTVGYSVQEATVESPVAKDTHLPAVTADLSAMRADMKASAIFKRVKSELETTDQGRDKIWTAVGRAIDGFLALLGSQYVAPAETIAAIYNRFKGTAKKRYDNESADIENFLLALRTADAQAAVQALPAFADLIAMLQKAQTDFDRASHTFYDLRADERSLRPASEIKAELIEMFNTRFVGYIDAMMLVDQEAYRQLHDRVHGYIDRVNRNVRARLKGQPEPYPELEGEQGRDDVTPDDGADAILPDKPDKPGGGQGSDGDDESRPMV